MEVTEEMRQAVRLEECQARGHSFDLMMTPASDIPHLIICSNCGRRAAVIEDKPNDAFDTVIAWLMLERSRYQTTKWDYAEDDKVHVIQGLTEDSWFWQRGVENYVGRVRLAQAQAGTHGWWTSPVAVQALLKLVATLASMPEHLLREGLINDLPEPGHPSGEIREWST